MIGGAVRAGVWAAFGALIVMLMRAPVEVCRPMPGGGIMCTGRARPPAGSLPVAEAAPLDRAAAVEAIIADPLPTRRSFVPLPTWLPSGVLGWEAEIHEAAGRVGLDPLALAILVSIECPSGNPLCSSHIVPPAVGLTQFMPGTAAAVAQRSGLPCEDRTDPVTSLRCGAYHLVELMSMCSALWADGREANALACAGTGYSAGPGYIPAIRAHVQAGGDPRTAPIPAETRRWVTSALDMWRKAGRQ